MLYKIKQCQDVKSVTVQSSLILYSLENNCLTGSGIWHSRYFFDYKSSSIESEISQDFPECDLLMVLGTSLVVHPFAALVHRVKPGTPRLIVNKEKLGIGILLCRIKF